jgi:lia operon protein LiaF
MQGKSFGGIILILVGLVFLGNQTGWFDVNIGYIFSTYWPVILIGFGLCGLLFGGRHHSGGSSYLWNLILIAIGVIFLNNNLRWFEWHFDFGDIIRFLVPVLIILYGLKLLFRSSDYDDRKYAAREARRAERYAQKAARDAEREARKYAARYGHKGAYSNNSGQPPHHSEHEHNAGQHGIHHGPEHGPEHGPQHGPQHGPHHGHHQQNGWEWKQNGVQNRSNMFGDMHIGQDYWELHPMNISHFIGDTELDLTKAEVPFGETRITVSAFIGDVKVYVPSDVNLELSCTASSFMGDIRVFERMENGLFKHMEYTTPSYREAGKKIKLTVSMFIGDVKVMRVG